MYTIYKVLHFTPHLLRHISGFSHQVTTVSSPGSDTAGGGGRAVGEGPTEVQWPHAPWESSGLSVLWACQQGEIMAHLHFSKQCSL